MRIPREQVIARVREAGLTHQQIEDFLKAAIKQH